VRPIHDGAPADTRVTSSSSAAGTWVTGEPTSFTAFATGQPAGDPTQGCGHSSATGWQGANCGYPSNGGLTANGMTAFPSVCESGCGNGVVDPGETCDPPGPACTKRCQTRVACTEAGAVLAPENGHCYFVSPTAVDYPTALASSCPAGTHLATLETPAETEAALAAIATDSWIALSAPTTLALFAWDVPGAVFDPLRYHGFGGDDPNQTPPAGVMVTNTPPSGGPGWRDRPQATLAPALCERDK
jgi:hypothetical protein